MSRKCRSVTLLKLAVHFLIKVSFQDEAHFRATCLKHTCSLITLFSQHVDVPHLSGGCCSPGNDYLCVHKKSLMFYFNLWKIRDQNQKCCICNLVRRVAHFAPEQICFPQLRFSLLLLLKSSDSTRLSSSLIILNIKHFFFIGFHSQTFHGSVVARKLDPAITKV